MTPEQALQFFAQVTEDLAKQLPPSAGVALAEKGRGAFAALAKANEPPAAANPE